MTATPVGPGYAVVAVDGSEEGYAAVSFAAREALREGLELRIAHVIPVSVPLRPLLMGTEHGAGAYASETLASATRVAADAAPQLPIRTHTLTGSRVSEIIELCERARFLVVGRRRSSALDRAWSGGTLDGVASRARCPVFVVPTATGRDDRPSRIVVGFKSPEHSAELFEAAFRDADELGAELQVVHAWKLPGVYDDIIARRVTDATCNREQKAAVRDLLRPWQESYPTIPVRIRVLHEHPVRALIEASREADRLVLVKPLHGGSVHHLGRTARGALRFAECPVQAGQASRRAVVGPRHGGAGGRARPMSPLPPRYVGWFFLWTSGIHVGIVAADPGLYRHFADDALVPGLDAAWRSLFQTHATSGGLVVAAGEALLGLLLLAASRSRRRTGWVGTIAFHVALMSFGWGFWMWCIPALALLVHGTWRDWPSADGPRSSEQMTLVDLGR